MARKPLILVTLISLVFLAQTVPGLADMVLPGGDGSTANWGSYLNGTDLGDAGNIFQAGYPNPSAWKMDGWRIAMLTNQYAVVPTQIDGVTTVAITYDTSNDYIYNIDDQQPDMPTKFVVWTTAADDTVIPIIASTDIQITINAKYNQDNAMTEGSIYGVGTNWLDNGAQFTLTGTLVPDNIITENIPHFDPVNGFTYETVVTGNSGHFTDLQINSLGAPTPIPGAVWLLGTGLLGLGCVGWRRRS
jgi:hypothetical protein